MGNGALHANPTVADIDITTHASDFLWAVFAVMLATALGLTAWTVTLHPGKRAFHWLGVAILLTASVAYFSMASDLGATPIRTEYPRGFNHGSPSDPTRSIWYARYIDWTVTTPLLLSTLLLGTGMPLSGIFITIFFDLVMIITGLIGSLVVSSYKWGYFAFGNAALFYVVYQLVGPARSAARFIGDDVHSSYVRSAVLLSFLWFLYPVAWGLADGGNVISPTSEMVFYGVLDLVAKPVWIMLHLFSMRNLDYERFGLSSGHTTLGGGQPIMGEKRV